ncbi:MAG: DUF29 family protein, partial [Cyanobacteriota bacterium]|nr:DUF29 family protein [Cyanobacteriota bacterium]
MMNEMNRVDFQAWINQTVQLLRDRQWYEIDIENLIQEIEDLGKWERGDSYQLISLLFQLLQSQSQPPEQQVQHRIVQLQNQVKCDHLLATIADKIRRSLNLEEILNTTVTEIKSLLQADRAIIYRFNPDWSGIIVAESVGSDWKPLLGKIIYDPCFAPNWVHSYQNGRIRAVSDVYKIDIAPCHLELLEQLQVRAKILVPIVLHPTIEKGKNSEQKLWGLLSANQCNHARQWQKFEIELLEKLAVQIAIAIQQSELYHNLEQRVEDRTLMLKQANQQLREEVIERQVAEEQLHQSLKKLSDIKYALDQSDIIAFTDAQGVIREVNDKFCQISKYHRDELIGNTHRIINSGYHPPEFFQEMWTTIRQ